MEKDLSTLGLMAEEAVDRDEEHELVVTLLKMLLLLRLLRVEKDEADIGFEGGKDGGGFTIASLSLTNS